jgi:hypothetical protein
MQKLDMSPVVEPLAKNESAKPMLPTLVVIRSHRLQPMEHSLEKWNY